MSKRKQGGFSGRSGRTARFLFWVGGFSLLALLLRLVIGFQLLRSDPSVFHPSSATDMGTYLAISEQIVSGKFPGEFYYQPFYYAVFLPFVRLIFPSVAAGIVIAQSILGALTVWLAGLLSARCMGRRAGILTACLTAGSQMLNIYHAYALLEVLQSFWFVLLLFLTLECLKKRKAALFFPTGLTWGCAILTRGNAWCFLPVLLIPLIRIFRENRKRAFYSLALLLAGVLLLQIPFAVVNSCKKGELCGPSTAGGNVLALGNSPESPAGELVYPQTFEVWTRPDSLKQRSIPGRIFDWAKEEPLAFLELQFRKCLLFWDSREIPNNILPQRSISLSPLLRTILGIPTGWIMLLAIAGICLNLRFLRNRGSWGSAVGFLLLYWLAAAAFYNLSRFRVPAIPLLCIAAGSCLPALCRKRRRFLFLLAAFLFAWFLVYPGYTLYRQYYEPAIMRLVRPHGVKAPSVSGGTRYFDNGPQALGGWALLEGDFFEKRFAPKTPPAAGTPVKLILTVVQREENAFLELNGQKFPMSLHPGRTAVVTIPSVWPKDGVFRICLSGISAVGDFQRNYGRTRAGEGIPLPAELVAEVLVK